MRNGRGRAARAPRENYAGEPPAPPGKNYAGKMPALPGKTNLVARERDQIKLSNCQTVKPSNQVIVE